MPKQKRKPEKVKDVNDVRLKIFRSGATITEKADKPVEERTSERRVFVDECKQI